MLIGLEVFMITCASFIETSRGRAHLESLQQLASGQFLVRAEEVVGLLIFVSKTSESTDLGSR